MLRYFDSAAAAKLASLVRQCTSPERAKRLQHYIDRHGYTWDILLQNVLLQMHARVGALDAAASNFECLRCRNDFTWNIMIAANAQNGHLLQAMQLFRKMPCHDLVSWNTIIAAEGKSRDAFALFHAMCLEGIRPGCITLATLLDVSASLEAIALGRFVHSISIECELHLDVIVGNSIVKMFGKCGCVDEAKSFFDAMPRRSVILWTVMVATFAQNGDLLQARTVFEKSPQRTTVTWNAMICGYSRDGKSTKALELYQQMIQVDGVAPDKVTIAAAIAACSILGDLQQGKLIQEQIERSVFRDDPHLKNLLINMYSSGHKLKCAMQVFDSAPDKAPVLVTGMIAAFAREGHLDEANKLLREALPTLDVMQCNILISAFAHKGYMQQAQQLFDGMQVRDAISWNSLIAAYADNGRCNEALQVFVRMELEGMKLGSITCVHILHACTQLQSSSTIGKLLYDEVRSMKTLSSDVLVQTAIINTFGKRGALQEARDMFDSMQYRNMVTWNAMISAYAQAGQGREALKVFQAMDLEGVEPSKITFIGILDACADLGFLQAGKEILASIQTSACVHEPVLSTAVVNMYSKCGMLGLAREVFDKTMERDAISWSAMIAAYAQNGHHLKAIEVFHLMSLEGIHPNETTFVLVLWASSHAGLLAQGMTHFLSMEVDYGVVPAGNHYACMVDVLGRLGCVEEAQELVGSMPFEPTRVERTTLLAACRMHAAAAAAAAAAKVSSVLSY